MRGWDIVLENNVFVLVVKINERKQENFSFAVKIYSHFIQKYCN